MNVVHHVRERRGVIRFNLISLAITLGAVGFTIISLTIITVIPIVLDFLGLSRTYELLVRIGRWPIMLFIASIFIATIYRFGPCRNEPKWRWISPGNLLASTGWLAGSLLFSWYAANFGSYNKIYGSLGAVIGFMTWFWLSTIVMLVGAKLDAEIEQTEHKC